MNDIKNLNQLIRKYKKNIKTAEDLLNTHPSTILNVLHKEYSEALFDLEQLKENLKNVINKNCQDCMYRQNLVKEIIGK